MLLAVNVTSTRFSFLFTEVLLTKRLRCAVIEHELIGTLCKYRFPSNFIQFKAVYPLTVDKQKFTNLSKQRVIICHSDSEAL